jgi:DNA-binding transcriptional ArsR family regulator
MRAYILSGMPRAATTSDVFNAIAEPQRRRILTLLQAGERSVNDMADTLALAQPLTSKHLRVLREVGLVRAREAGRQRLYRLDAGGLRRVHEWTGGFADFWQDSFDRLETYVTELQREEDADAGAGDGS